MKIRGLLLDVEGVLVADKRYQAVPGAVDFIHAARAAGCPLRLITNNTTDPRPAIREKLNHAGFGFALEEVHTCTDAAQRRLRDLGARRCLVLANETMRAIFAEGGCELVDGPEVDAVVIGLDTDLTYQRLQWACEAAISHDAKLITLHRNRLYTNAGGRPAPSVGALTAAIEYATGREAEIIGKPSATYFRQALDELAVPAGDVLLVSDDPLTDLVGGRAIGLRTAFVLSGKYPTTDILDTLPAGHQPDETAARIGELLTHGIITFATSPRRGAGS